MRLFLFGLFLVVASASGSVHAKVWPGADATISDYQDLVDDAEVLHESEEGLLGVKVVFKHDDYGLLWCRIGPEYSSQCMQMGKDRKLMTQEEYEARELLESELKKQRGERE